MKQALKTTCLTGALAGVGLAAAPAHADFFFGGTVGQSDIGAYEFSPGETIIRNDDSDTAWHLFAGWQFNDYLAVTAGYADLGALNAAGSFDGGEGGYSYTDKIEATAFDASLIGILPLGGSAGGTGFLSRVSLFAQVGFAQVEQDIRYVENGVPWLGNDDGTNFIYGVGISFEVTDHFGVHARWVDYGDIGDRNSPDSGHEQDWRVWGAGFTFRFGGGSP